MQNNVPEINNVSLPLFQFEGHTTGIKDTEFTERKTFMHNIMHRRRRRQQQQPNLSMFVCEQTALEKMFK